MKILFVDPHESSIFSFRKEVLDELIRLNYEVILCTNVTPKIENEYGQKVSKLIDVKLNLKDKNPFSNLKLASRYKKIIRQEKPDIILSYKIKPNLYCGFASKNVVQIANITGLGKIFEKHGLLSRLGLFLYRKAFKNINFVFFQNESGYQFFKSNRIPLKDYKVIPGSGVNVKTFAPLPKRKRDGQINFLFASRAIKEKGYDLLLEAIPVVLSKTSIPHFNFVSAEEDIFRDNRLKLLLEKYPENVSLVARTDDMVKLYNANDFTLAPSYYKEGMSNILLESLACETPIITTNDNPGCVEVLRDGINGFGVRSNNIEDLISAIEKAANTSIDERVKMGKSGRAFVSANFNREDVVKTYIDIVKSFF